MQERYQSSADIKGVSVETMSILLEFVYSQSITVTSESVFDLYVAADYMQIPCKF